MALRPITATLLCYLIRQRERIVTKEELLETVWEDAAVSDNVLMQSVKELRRVFGDSPRNPAYIKTFPKRGYRWIFEPVNEVESSTPREEADFKVTPEPKRPWRLLTLPALLLIVLSTALLYWLNNQKDQTMAAGAEVLRVVVMPFLNQTGDEQYQWLEQGLSDMVAGQLGRGQRLETLPAMAAHTALAELGKRRDQLSTEDYKALLKEADAHVVLIGEVHRQDTRLRFDYLLQGRDRSERGSMSFGDLSSSVPELVSRLNRELLGEELEADPVYSRSEKANRDYARGLEALNTRGAPLARHYFEAALIHDPRFTWARAQLALAQYQLGAWDQSLENWRTVAGSEQVRSDITLRVFAANGIGSITLRRGDMESAGHHLAEAHRLCDDVKDTGLVAEVLFNMADLRMRQGKTEEFNALMKRVAEVSGSLQGLRGQADSLFYLGRNPYRHEGETAAQRDRLELALAYYRELGHLRRQAYTLLALGANNACAGDKRNHYITEALELFRALQDKAGTGLALGALGMTHIQGFVFDKAVEPLEQALEIVRDLKAVTSEARVLHMLGTAYLGKSVTSGKPEFRQPRDLLQQSLQLFERIGLDREKVEPHFVLILLGLEEGDHTAVRYHLDAARRLMPKGGKDYFDLFEARFNMDKGEWARAAALLEGLKFPGMEHLVLAYRARSAYEMGEYARAVTTIEDLRRNYPKKWTIDLQRRGEIYRAAQVDGVRRDLPAESGLLTAMVR
ncbi:MAG: winged helix-turn-helix domain-containing protein [Acidobacteriota bacterium]|nr:winged helix-turn-helix domain-containing protein [Acidobacteriota bacterium]